MYLPSPPCSPTVLIIRFPFRDSIFLACVSSACNIHQIDQGHNEHPHDIDELPEQMAVFNMRRAVTPALVAQADNQESDQRRDHVQEFHSSNAEIRTPKQA